MTVDEQATSATRDMKLNVPVGTVYRYKNVQAENLVQDDTMSVSSTTTSYYTKTITANAGGSPAQVQMGLVSANRIAPSFSIASAAF